MRLGLSSAAAPDLPLADLVEACGRRGLSALELVAGDGHGVGADPGAVAPSLERAREAGVPVAAMLLGGDPAEWAAGAELSARLGLPVVVPASGIGVDGAVRAGRSFAAAGGRLLLLHPTDPEAVRALRAVAEALPAGSVALAWEVDPSTDDPSHVPDVLDLAGPRLAHVRLRGGGPEAMEQTGRGVGALMARLALARYGGPLILTPSTPRYHQAWRAWLGRGGGWGCGSRQSDPSLVTLPLAAGDRPRREGT